MSLIETINEDFKTAFKAREMEKKDFLGLLKSEVTRDKKDPSDAEIIATIKSMIKSNDKAIKKSGTSEGTMTDLELEILNGYLPEVKMFTEGELKN